MPIPIPFFVYGNIYDGNRAVISGATVSVSTEETDTNSDGAYQLNIQDVATDGASVTVYASYTGRNARKSFTLDVGDVAKNIDIIIPTLDVNVIKSDKSFYVLKSDKSFSINYDL